MNILCTIINVNWIFFQKNVQSLCSEAAKLVLQQWNFDLNFSVLTFLIANLMLKWIETYCLECSSFAWNTPVSRDRHRILDG